VEPEEEKSKGVSIVDLQSSYLIFMWLFLVLKKKNVEQVLFLSGWHGGRGGERSGHGGGWGRRPEGKEVRRGIFLGGGDYWRTQYNN